MRLEKDVLVFSPYRKEPFYLEKEEVPLPVRKRKNGYVATKGDLVFIPSDVARVLYGVNPSTPFVLVNPEKGVCYEIEEVKQSGLFLTEKEKKNEKEAFEVYETPDRVFGKVREILAESTRRAVLALLEKPSLKSLLSVWDEDKLLSALEGKATDVSAVALEEAKKHAEVLKLRKEVREAKDFLGWLEENWERVRVHLPSSLAGEEKPPLVVFDPQAGSGKILDSLPSWAVLTGFEIRPVEPKRENYRVITGMDSTVAFDVMEEELSWIRRPNFPYSSSSYVSNYSLLGSEMKKEMEELGVAKAHTVNSIAMAHWWINPPYTGDRRVARETFSSIPSPTGDYENGGLVMGLISPVDLPLLKRSGLSGVYFLVPREGVGYGEEETPEKFVFFVGFKRKQGESGNLSFGGELERIEDLDVKDLVDRLDLMGYDFKTPFLLQAGARKFLPLALEKVREKVQNAKVPSLEEALSPLSLENLAFAGKPVFPALHLYENGVFLTFKEIAGNPELLSLYRERYPYLFEVAKKVSEKTGIPLAVGKSEQEYTVAPPERLGLMRYRYLPTVIDLSEKVADVLLELVSEKNPDDLEKLEALLSAGSFIWIKNLFSSTTGTGEESFGYVPVVAICDEAGRTLGRVEVSVDELYERLEKEGLLQKSAKHVSEHPRFREELLRLIEAFARDVRRNVLSEEDRAFIERAYYEEKKKPGQIAVELYEKWKEKRKDFVSRLWKFDVHREAKAGALSVLRARQVEGKTELLNRILGEVEKIFEEFPVNFSANLYEIENPEFAKKYTDGLPVREWIKERFLEAFGDETLADDLASVVAGAYGNYRQLVQDSVLAIEKIVRTYLIAERMEKLLKSDPDRAVELFRALHLNVLKLLPHQFEEALHAVLKARLTGEVGHLLGWEMRSGKTLAMGLSGYFSSLLNGNETYMLVRSANLFDISRQITFFLPHVALRMRVYPNQELASRVFGDETTSRVLSKRAIPNLFKFPELFRRKGTGVKDLLSDNAFIRIENYAKEEWDPSPVKGKPYEKLLYLEGFPKDLLKGLVRYIYENEEEFVLSPEPWEKFLKSVAKWGEDLKNFEEEGALVHLVSKETYLLGVNYRLERDRKTLAKGVEATAEVEPSKASDEDFKKLGDYYLLPESYAWELPEEDREHLVLAGRVVYRSGREESLYLFDYRDLQSLPYGAISLREFVARIHDRDRNKFLKRKFGEGISSLKVSLPFLVPYYDKEEKDWRKVEGEGETHVSVGGQTLEVLYDVRNAPRPVEGLRSNARTIVYESGLFDGHNLIVDEIDQSSSRTSEVYRAIKSVKAPFKLASTGTVSNGTVQSVVELLGLVSPLRYDAIEDTVRTIRDLYGTFTISDKHEGFYRDVFTLFMNARTKGEQTLKSFVDSFVSLVRYDEEYETARDLLYELARRAGDLGVLTADVEENLYRIASLVEDSSPLSFSVVRFLKSLAGEIERRITYYSEGSYSSVVFEALYSTLKREGVLREGVGTLNPVSFVKALSLGVSVSLMTRELLKGKEEKLLLPDDVRREVEAYRKTKDWPLSPRDSLAGGLKVLEEAEEDRPAYVLTEVLSLAELLTKNEGLSEEQNLRTLLDASNVAGATSQADFFSATELRHRFRMLTIALGEIARELEKDSSLRDLVVRRAKTTEDDLPSVARAMLLEGDFETDLEDEALEGNLSRKKEFAREVLSALTQAEVERNEKDELFIRIRIRGKTYEVKVRDEELKHYLSEGRDFSWIFEERYSVLIDLSAGRGWKREIFVDRNPSYPYRFKLVGSKEEELVDVISNEGYRRIFEGLYEDGKKAVITPSRVHALSVILGDLLNVLTQKKNDPPVQVIVRVSTPSQREFVSRIDRDFLKERGVILKVVKTQAELEVATSSVKDAPGPVFLLAPAQTVSRGVDFSMFDALVVPGTLDGKGREFSQLLARLYNSTDKNSATVYLFGTPLRFSLFVLPNGTMERRIAPTMSAFVQSRLLTKAEFSRSLLSGRIESFTPTTGSVVVEDYSLLEEAQKREFGTGPSR